MTTTDITATSGIVVVMQMRVKSEKWRPLNHLWLTDDLRLKVYSKVQRGQESGNHWVASSSSSSSFLWLGGAGSARRPTTGLCVLLAH